VIGPRLALGPLMQQGAVWPVRVIEQADDWNRANSTNLGGAWSELAASGPVPGNIAIMSHVGGAGGHAVRTGGATAAWGLRNTPITSADQYATMSFEPAVVAFSGAVGVVVRAQSIVADPNGYALYVQPTPPTSSLILARVTGGSSTTLATASVSVAVGVPFELALEIVGSNLRGYFNSSLVVTATDSTYSSAGRVGFRLDPDPPSYPPGNGHWGLTFSAGRMV